MPETVVGEVLAPLVVLALIDSTSFGTLLIPIWLMLAPGRLRASRILLYLATVGVFYLGLGVLLLAGVSWVSDAGDSLDRSALQTGQLALGVLLMVVGVTIEPWTKTGKEKKAARRASRGPGRLQRWRRRAVSGGGSHAALMALAFSATAIEAASMLPYLTAIGVIGTVGLSVSQSVSLLAGYCVVMVLPALALTATRVVFESQVTPTLARLEAWLSKNSGELTAWLLFLVGFFLASGAVRDLYVSP